MEPRQSGAPSHPLVAVARNKFEPGFPHPEARPIYRVRPLREALLETYKTDAHLITYVVDGATKQQRIRKEHLPDFEGLVQVGVLFCDVDNPDHRLWDESLSAEAMRQYETLHVLQTAGVYHTQRGRRFVQPLIRPVLAAEAEAYLRSWLFQLEAAGIDVDWSCRDWTRHFRLPNVRRDGRPYRSPYLQLDRMVPIEIASAAPIAAPARAAGARARRALPVTIDWTQDVPAIWRNRVERIALAVKQISDGRHPLYMALAGALLARGAPPQHVPALCRAISIATGSDPRTAGREHDARTTVERWLAQQPTLGYGELSRRWPDVADAFDLALARGNEAQLRAQAAAVIDVPLSLGESTAAMEDAYRRAPDGATLVSAECGLGKTRAAENVAAERAAKPYATKTAQGLHAPLQSKTAISVDKTELAKQIVTNIRAKGVAVRRIFGPLSVKRPDGAPECQYHEVAKPLVDGGQSMQWELCLGRNLERCRYYDQCTARLGVDGPDGARITVGPHSLVGELSAEAGKTGLLIIDEPPPVLESVVLSIGQIDVARETLRAFDGRYAGAMTPALEAARAWVDRRGAVNEPTELAHAIRACASAVTDNVLAQGRRSAGLEEGDAVECAVAAPLPEKRRGTAPPLRAEYVLMARDKPALAHELGTASKVLGSLYHALTSDSPVAVSVDERQGERVLVLLRADEAFADALKRQGAVVVTDANAEIHAPIYERVLGYAPPHHRFAARDGAPIERTLIRCASATRKTWLPHGQLALVPSLVSALRAVFDWAGQDPSAQLMGLITMRPIEVAIDAALHPDKPTIANDWERCGQDPARLKEVRDLFASIVRAWPGQILLAHYGAVRGLNTMAEVDCLATLGDAWINIGDVQNQIDFLGLPNEQWEARAAVLCRAELEQAHGRLRFVHRTRPGRALHVGNTIPGGSGWSSGKVKIRRFRTGRPKAATALDALAFAAIVTGMGGIRATARSLGCDPATVKRYLDGRAIPQDIAQRALAAAPSHLSQETSYGL